MKSKICGISDSRTLEHLIGHSNPPQYIGFIVNYLKSKRFVPLDKLKKLLKVGKKNSKYVAVLVRPDKSILEHIINLQQECRGKIPAYYFPTFVPSQNKTS